MGNSNRIILLHGLRFFWSFNRDGAAPLHALRRRALGYVGLVSCVLMVLTAPITTFADVTQDVPEAKSYTTLFDLTIPTKSGFHSKAPTYTQNKAGTFLGPFDRIAYFLELQKAGQPRRYMWVSMKAFTADPTALALPHAGGGGVFQQKVDELNIVTNQPGVQAGTKLATGNVEMWPGNYGMHNNAAIPGASATLYDAGDSPLSTAGYGSFQVHNHGAKTTLFAYNAWGNSAVASDLGIGNNTTKTSKGTAHPDWTFRHNAAEYQLRRLRIFVRKGPTPGALTMHLTSPQPHQVLQRNAQGLTWVRVSGSLLKVGTRVEARAIPEQGGVATAWAVIDPKPGKSFVGHLQVSQGWYRMEVRLMKGTTLVAMLKSDAFGVGEVFITAGQSNSANSGKPAQSPKDQRVGAWGPAGWQWAKDPQPIATGTGGTPWPALGDLLLAKFGVPIGFISVGWGGTTVTQWQPGHAKKLFPRLQLALNELGPFGVRAVLWHQGESDAASKTTKTAYAQKLQSLISASRKEAGWDLPWYVARVGYLPNLTKAAINAVVAGQQAVIDTDPLVFPGAQTDDLIGKTWRHDNVHFNAVGLTEHAKRWAALIPVPSITPPSGQDAGSTDAGASDSGGSVSDAGATSDAGVLDASPPDATAADITTEDINSSSNNDTVNAVEVGPKDVSTDDSTAAALAADASNPTATQPCDCPPVADEGCGATRHGQQPAWPTFLMATMVLVILRRRRSLQEHA